MLKRLSNRKIVIGLLTTLILLTAVGINYAIGVDGPTVKQISLQDAIDLAMKNNADVEIAALSVEKAKLQYDSAKETAKKLDEDYVTTYNAGIVKWITPKDTENRLVLAEKGKELAENSLKFSVESAYYNVLKAERNLQIKRENLKYFQDQLKIAQTGYKIGTKAKVDVSVIEASVASMQAGVTSEDKNYRTAVMELNKLTGLDLDTSLKLTTKFNVEKTSSTIKLDDTIKEALDDNFQLLGVKKDAELKKVQYDVAKRFYTGGVTIFDTAEIDAKSAAATQRQQELATTALVRESYLSLLSLEQMIDWQTKEVDKAKENARVFNLKYQAGLATSLDVKKATIDLEQAEGNLSDTIYNYNLLKSQFKYNLFTTGKGSSAPSGSTASGMSAGAVQGGYGQ